MSMIIRYKLEGAALADPPAVGFPAPLAPSQDDGERAGIIAAAVALARRFGRAIGGSSRDDRETCRDGSVFHAWAAADLADRDVARQIWRDITRVY